MDPSLVGAHSDVDDRGAYLEMAFRRDKLEEIEGGRRYANHD